MNSGKFTTILKVAIALASPDLRLSWRLVFLFFFLFLPLPRHQMIGLYTMR